MFDEVVQIKAIRYFELMFYAVYFYFVSFLKQSEIVARFIGFLSGIAKSFECFISIEQKERLCMILLNFFDISSDLFRLV